ncbi:putative DUF1320 domain-containing protein [Candidatus Magnetomoraceae bacterium gMMP-15]
MEYCTTQDIADYILQQYLDKLEEMNPGVLTRRMEAVFEEIDSGISSKYSLPLEFVPARLRRIAAVLAGYRAIGAITSLIETEAGTENQFLYLQREYMRVVKELNEIKEACSEGEDVLELEESSNIIQVSTKNRIFTNSVWEQY